MAAEARLDDGAGRPLVTFALFAYNQEQYVREAIESAFAQTYQPLEIILSDDCSPDSTFMIMQEMAAAYSGPHKVSARQSPQNRRVLRHVLDVAKLARGKYLVVAAGDDISVPHRTERLVELLEKEEGDFAWSAYDPLEDSDENVQAFVEDFATEAKIFNLPVRRILGATAAYRTSILQDIPDLTKPIFYEDSFFEVSAAINNHKIVFDPDKLLKYRILANSLSMRKSPDAAQMEENLATRYERISETVLTAIETFSTAKTMECRPELDDLRKQAVFYKRAAEWARMSFLDRLRLALAAPDRKAFKWALPRALLGWRLFIIARGLRTTAR